MVTRDDAIRLIENGMRNWPHIPRISEDDLEDLRASLEGIVRRHRQSAIAELCEGLDAEFASAAQKLEVPEGHPDKPQRDFAIGVLWALQEAIHTRALLSKHSPDAPGDERHG